MSFELTKKQSELADKLLKKMCLSDSESVFGRNIVDEIFESKNESNLVCSYLENLELIKIIGKTENNPLYAFRKTDKACALIKSGGLTKMYIRNRKILEKESYDFNISKLKSKTFLLSLLIAVIIAGIGFYNFIENLSTSKNKVETEQKIEQPEKELIKSQTSILNQKNLDSVRDSKALTELDNKDK